MSKITKEEASFRASQNYQRYGANYKFHPNVNVKYNQSIKPIETGLPSNEVTSKSLDATEDKIIEINAEIKKLHDLITDLTAKTNSLEKENTGLTDQINTFNKSNSDIGNKITTIESHQQRLTSSADDYQQRITVIESTLKPIHDTYTGILNILSCSWCDFSRLTGNTVEYTEDFS